MWYKLREYLRACHPRCDSYMSLTMLFLRSA
jgi:hypothetical protein